MLGGGQIDVRAVVEILKASLGPGVAALGVAVAIAQWHTNDVKLRLDSYDRRLRVYKATVAMLDCMISEIYHRTGIIAHANENRPERPYTDIPAGVKDAFEDCLIEAPFLFDDDVARFMSRIEGEAWMIKSRASSLAGISPAAARGTLHETEYRLLRDAEKRVKKARERVRDVFGRYLALQRSQR